MPPLNIVPGDPSSASTSVKPIPAPIVPPEQSKALERESLQRAQEIAEQLTQVVGPRAVPPAALGEQIDPQTGALMPSPTMMLMQATPPPEAEAAPAPGGAPAPEGQAPPPPPPEQKMALDANSVFRLAWEARHPELEKQANIGGLIRGAAKLPSLAGKAFRGARSALGGLSRAKAPARPRSPLPKASPGGQATTVNYVPPAKNPALQKTYVPPNPPSGGNMASTAHYSGTRPFQNTPVRQGPAAIKVPASSFPARAPEPSTIPSRVRLAPNPVVDAAQKGVGLAAIGGGLAGATYVNQKSDDWMDQLLKRKPKVLPQHMAQRNSLFGR